VPTRLRDARRLAYDRGGGPRRGQPRLFANRTPKSGDRRCAAARRIVRSRLPMNVFELRNSSRVRPTTRATTRSFINIAGLECRDRWRTDLAPVLSGRSRSSSSTTFLPGGTITSWSRTDAPLGVALGSSGNRQSDGRPTGEPIRRPHHQARGDSQGAGAWRS